MFKNLGSLLKKGMEVAKDLSHSAMFEHIFELDEMHQRFILKKTTTTFLLNQAQSYSNGDITDLVLNDDHLEVTVQKKGVQIVAKLSFTQIEVDSEIAQIHFKLASPPGITGAHFLGRCIAWLWRIVLGSRLDSLSSIDGLDINGANIRYQTKADELEILRLLVGTSNQRTTLNVDIQNHEIIFTAVEPEKFSPDIMGLISFFSRQGKEGGVSEREREVVERALRSELRADLVAYEEVVAARRRRQRLWLFIVCGGTFSRRSKTRRCVS